mgnify:CR=1 FL=1
MLICYYRFDKPHEHFVSDLADELNQPAPADAAILPVAARSTFHLPPAVTVLRITATTPAARADAHPPETVTIPASACGAFHLPQAERRDGGEALWSISAR